MNKTYREAVMKKKKMPKNRMPMKGDKCPTCGKVM